MRARPIKYVYSNSRRLVIVPIGRKGGREAVLYKEDYDSLMELGLSPNWCATGNCVVCRGPDQKVTPVARVIMEAGPRERVQYIDGNGFNLRRDNLTIAKGWSKHSYYDLLWEPLWTKRQELEVVSGD